MSIKILIDSSSDLPLDLAEQNQIRIIPIKLSINDKTYRDKFDISSQGLYSLQRNEKVMPKTMQITPSEFFDAYKEELENHDELIVLTLASNASGTYQSACLAKEMIQDEQPEAKITIVDSKHLSFGYAVAALEGAKLISEGKNSEEIIQKMNSIINNIETFFTVESLEYLKKGGRIKPTAAIIGGMLDIRPILKVSDGLVGVTDKVRGEKKAVQTLGTIAKDVINDKNNCVVIILKSDAEAIAQTLSNDMQEFLGKQPDYIIDLGPVIASHSGPGVLGISIINC